MTRLAALRPVPRLEASRADPRIRLQGGIAVLPALVHWCHHATITTVTAGRLQVCVATDPVGRRADDLQDELGEGPCLQAVRTGHSVVAHALPTQTRWLDWCAAAVGELGVRAVASVRLRSNLWPLATLNLYSDWVDGLAGVDIGLLHTLVDPSTGALVGVRDLVDRLGPAA